MRKLSIFIITACLTINLFATGQIDDTLIYKGSKRYLQTYPLEQYFKKYPNKRPETKSSSTGLWRNYVATYEIRNNQLFLKDIQIMQVNYKSTKLSYIYKSVMNKVFPNNKNIKAIWFTGLMEVTYGKVIDIPNEPYGSVTFENYIIMEINNGDLIKEKHINYKIYDEFKERQFQAFKKTDDYQKAVISLKKHHITKGRDNLIKESILEYTNKLLTE